MTLSITFSAYDMALIEKAASKMLPYHNHPSCADRQRKDYRRIIDLAVLAFTRGVIAGNISGTISDNVPMIAKLRRETHDEMTARIKKEIFVISETPTEDEPEESPEVESRIKFWN